MVPSDSSKTNASITDSFIARQRITTPSLFVNNINLGLTSLTSSAESSQTFSLPDSFVLTSGDQTVNGLKTLTQTLTLSNTSNQIILGSGQTFTITAPSPAASLVYTIPDVGGDTYFLMANPDESINGKKMFRKGIEFLKGSGKLNHYSSFTGTLTFTSSFRSSFPPCTLLLERVGRSVTMTLSSTQALPDKPFEISSIFSLSAIPEEFRPSEELTERVTVMNDGILMEGVCSIAPNGFISMSRLWVEQEGPTITSSEFSGSGQSEYGFRAIHSSWCVL